VKDEAESGFDPEQLRLRDDQIPTIKLETETDRQRKKARARLYVPPTDLSTVAAVGASGVSGRAVCLWLTIRTLTKVQSQEWVRVPTHLREQLGFRSRMAHSRAVLELEKAGFLDVQRRKGFAPLVRPTKPRSGERGGGGGDEDDTDE
jgi:hypothetical protein